MSTSAAAEDDDAARQAPAQLALAVELGGIGLWRHDLVADRMHFNTQAMRGLGIAPRPEGLPLDEFLALVHPQDLPRVRASAAAALHSDQPTDLEARYRGADGSWREVLTRRIVQRDADGRALGFVGVAIDITEQRKAEHTLRVERERVAMATRAAGIGTWEFEPASGTAFWDEQMWRLRGIERPADTSSAGQRMDHVHPDDRELIRQAMAEAARNEQPQEYEFRVVWPDGQVRWLASRSIAQRDANGVLRRIGANWDVTDRRAAEAARREREIALGESRAKSRFLARMSHELRTPLNAVLGFAQLLMDDETGPDAASALRRRRLEHVRSAGRELLALVDDVLDLARLEGGEIGIARQPVALAPLVAEALAMVQPLALAQRLQIRTGDLAHAVLGDALRLRQVLLTVLSNAVRTSRDGGRVSIDAEVDGAATAEARVVLRVSDSGPGMTAAQLAQLFQPFSRLHADAERGDGSGVGLAVAKALVEHMGASIAARSEPGAGSTVEIRLVPAPPMAAWSVEASAPAAASSPEPATRRRRILYIEDNPVNALIIRELVARRIDLELDVAADGTSGVARALSWLPELILLDMQLPDFDGIEVMRRLHAAPETAATPVIA
ncbi:MAG: PAS domain-containing protein, partial [Burkholderiales bacterium]|nr:PAS domain-containing protein [Burkholderiales bacterium]